jgi:hypothetical protein
VGVSWVDVSMRMVRVLYLELNHVCDDYWFDLG